MKNPLTKLASSLDIQKILPIFVTLLLIITSSLSNASFTFEEQNNQKILASNLDDTEIFSFTFPVPQIIEGPIGKQINMEGLDQFGQPGYPKLPQKTIKLLLPPNKTIKEIDATTTPYKTITGNYYLPPSQQPTPYNFKENITLTKPNNKVYESTSFYPENTFKFITLQKYHGYSIAIINIYPVRYSPKNREIQYCDETTLTIEYQQTVGVSKNPLRYNLKDSSLVEKEVINAESIIHYNVQSHQAPVVQKTSGLVSAEDTYEYVIITNEALKNSQAEYTFQDLIQSKIDKGLNATIVTVEDIISNPAYWVNGTWGDNNIDNPFVHTVLLHNFSCFNDTAAKIRNFIRDAYVNWQTEYILLGGDGDGADVGSESGDNIIPPRLCLGTFMVGLEEIIASDVYFTCLDGNFNYDEDNLSGEVGDGYDIDLINGEVDLYSEVFVGRVPIDKPGELSNFIRKTLTYEQSDGNQYLLDVLMVGEHLGFGGIADWGGNYKDEIRYGSDLHFYSTAGVSPAYDVNHIYDREWELYNWSWPYRGYGGWEKQNLTDLLNDSVHIINHLGHGNNYHVMKLDEPVMMRSGKIYNVSADMSNLENQHPFFMYSQACFPGAFDNMNIYNCTTECATYDRYDCIIEYMLGAENASFACIANTRSGLGSMDTDAPSQSYDREFFDALYGEQIRSLAHAHQDSKHDNLGRINEDGWRYSYYSTTYFGDPELHIKDPPLYTHDLNMYNIKTPDYLLVNRSGFVNVSIYNRGQNQETNVHVNFYVNNNLTNTQIIPLFPSQTNIDVSFAWETHEIGKYDILVEVDCVAGEENLQNNNQTAAIFIVSSKTIRVCIVDSIGSDLTAAQYTVLREEWDNYGEKPVWIDYYTLSRDDLTYQDFLESKADVLIIDNALYNPQFDFFHYEYTQDELNAIIQYVNDGHGLIIMGDSFGGNNHVLKEYVGLSNDLSVFDGGNGNAGEFETILNISLFKNIETGYDSSALVYYPRTTKWRQWNKTHIGTGALASKSIDGRSIVVVNNKSIYLSTWVVSPTNPNDLQLLYNSIVFVNTPPSLFISPHGPYQGIVDEPIKFTSSAYGNNTDVAYWHWDFGDGNTSNMQNPTHIYTKKGTYDITLTVENNHGEIACETTKAHVLYRYVWVDDDALHSWYDENHVSDIKEGINSAAEKGYVYVAPGRYYENILINQTVHLIGENQNTTIIDAGFNGTVIQITPYCYETLIQGFTIQNCGSNSSATDVGIHIENAGYSTIQSNNILNNTLGIYVSSSSYCQIQQNIITANNEHGISIIRSYNQNITQNQITDNCGNGIAIRTSRYNTITYNYVAKNEIGLFFDESASNSLVSNNDFIFNNMNAYESFNNYTNSTNYWNNTYPKGGNFWSDYDEPNEGAYDTFSGPNQSIPGSDGIIDTPYVIPGHKNSNDTYPLMKPMSNQFIIETHGPYRSITNASIPFKGEAVGGIPPYQFYWDFGDHNISNEQNPTHTYQKIGQYNLTLYVEDSIHENQTSRSYVLIKPQININASTENHGYYNEEVHFTCSATGGYPPYHYAWDFNGDSQIDSNNKNPTWTFTSLGVHKINITVTDLEEFNSTKTILVNVTPRPMHVSAGGPYTADRYIPILFHGSVTGGMYPYNYSWDFGDQNTAYTANPTHNYSQPGKYNVSLTITDALGTKQTSYAVVWIKHPSYSIIWVDDNYNENTPGWNYDHFSKIQDGVGVSGYKGTVNVSKGVYNETIHIEETLTLKGENNKNTILQNEDNAETITVNAPEITITGFTIKTKPDNKGWGTAIKLTNSDKTVVEHNIIQGFSTAIYAENSEFIEFNANNISDISISLDFIYCNKSRISHNTITNVTAVGISLSCSHEALIDMNTITLPYQTFQWVAGMSIYGSNNSWVIANTITNTLLGIILAHDSNDNYLFGNTLSNMTYSGIKIENPSNVVVLPSTYNKIYSNTITNCNPGILVEKNSKYTEIDSNQLYNAGISIDLKTLEDWSTLEINGNQINNKPVHFYKDNNNSVIQNETAQIFLLNCRNITIQNILFNDSTTPIFLINSYNCIIKQNVISENKNAIKLLLDSNNNEISENIISCNSETALIIDKSHNNSVTFNGIVDNQIGIMLKQSSNNTIADNIITDNFDSGCILLLSDYNVIEQNTIQDNSRGIDVAGSQRNTVRGNRISNHGFYGIGITKDYNYHIPSNNNSVYHNNFINNMEHAYDSCGNNFWDNDYPSSGNYWDTFDEPSEGAYDINGDGVVDSPFNITAYSDVTGQDRYPLLNQWAGVEPMPVCGDINIDGMFDVGDAVLLINYIFKGDLAPLPAICVADVNGDGDVNVGDAVYIINYVFKGGPGPSENCCQ